MVDAQKERQRVTEHLDKVSDACRKLRGQKFNNYQEGFPIVEDAIFNILQALRLMQGEDDE